MHTTRESGTLNTPNLSLIRVYSCMYLIPLATAEHRRQNFTLTENKRRTIKSRFSDFFQRQNLRHGSAHKEKIVRWLYVQSNFMGRVCVRGFLSQLLF